MNADDFVGGHSILALELSIPETASLLNCKTATAKQRLVRGKKLLQKQLLEEEKI